MNELDDFRSTTLTRFVEAEEALHNGDPEPRLAMWSDQDPVTLFGAWGPCKSGWEEVSPVFRWLASRFSGVSDYRLDIVAADLSGDLAYTVGFERSRLYRRRPRPGERATRHPRVPPGERRMEDRSSPWRFRGPGSKPAVVPGWSPPAAAGA